MSKRSGAARRPVKASRVLPMATNPDPVLCRNVTKLHLVFKRWAKTLYDIPGKCRQLTSLLSFLCGGGCVCALVGHSRSPVYSQVLCSWLDQALLDRGAPWPLGKKQKHIVHDLIARLRSAGREPSAGRNKMRGCIVRWQWMCSDTSDYICSQLQSLAGEATSACKFVADRKPAGTKSDILCLRQMSN